jgi:hypothetical protein
MKRRSFFKGIAATIGAAAIKVGARIAYVRNGAELRAIFQGGQKVEKVMLKRGEVFHLD